MWLERSKLLFGEERLARLQGANVLVVGLGGVGAYAARNVKTHGAFACIKVCFLKHPAADALSTKISNLT